MVPFGVSSVAWAETNSWCILMTEVSWFGAFSLLPVILGFNAFKVGDLAEFRFEMVLVTGACTTVSWRSFRGLARPSVSVSRFSVVSPESSGSDERGCTTLILLPRLTSCVEIVCPNRPFGRPVIPLRRKRSPTHTVVRLKIVQEPQTKSIQKIVGQ